MRARLLFPLYAAALLLAGNLGAQTASSSALRSEFAQLRSAAELEAAGDAPGAERIVRSVLQTNPTSLVALLALERVLAQQGRISEILPVTAQVLARDAGSTLAHQVRLRAVLLLGRTEELQRAGDAWIEAAPEIETPYREIARAWLQRHEPLRALRVLERGRKAIGDERALALEIGEVHAIAGDFRSAAREWSHAIGSEGQGFAPVQRRLGLLPEGGAAVIGALAGELARAPTSLARRRAAAQLLLQAGLAEAAEKMIPELLRDIPGADREQFLAEIARRADGAGVERTALWAYRQLLDVAEGDSTRLLALRTRVAQLSLAAGDSAGAARMYQSVERAGAPGSAERRQAAALRIALTAREAATAELVEAVAEFRRDNAESPELEQLTATIGAELLHRGDLPAAERVLTGATGTRAALLRSRVFLRRGELERASSELLLAAPRLAGGEATRAIATANALGSMVPEAGQLIAAALERADQDVAVAVQELVRGAATFEPRTRAAILDFAAGTAEDAGLAEAAELARREIVSALPQSDVAPAALLWLAERSAPRAETRAEARVLLERLIVEHPRSALAPQARRALERLASPAPGGDEAQQDR
jgi:tetratricopeptide (TPR) repeat protein